jgi:hypothetical protein
MIKWLYPHPCIATKIVLQGYSNKSQRENESEKGKYPDQKNAYQSIGCFTDIIINNLQMLYESRDQCVCRNSRCL